jgi:hypothetical protein
MSQVNHRGSIKFTNRLLEELLNLPEGVKITGLKNDLERQTTEFYIQSEEKVEGFTFPTNEGLAPMSINYESYVEHVKNFANNLSIEDYLQKKPKAFKSWR